jgi:hypothetical protein
MFGKEEKSIQELLNRLTGQKGIKNKLHQQRIEKMILQLLGPSIYAYLSKVSFKEGVLYLTLTNDSLKNELFFGKEKIINNLNEMLGEELIKKIFFE